MEAQLKSRDGKITFKLTGNTQIEIFEAIAHTQEVFDAASECGCCGSREFRFLHRVVDDNSYYELACLNQDCRAKLGFGQHKKGDTLFVKKKDKDGNWLPNGGWIKFQRPASAGASTAQDREAW